MLEPKRLNKAVVPQSLIPHPSPASLQSTRLALHANGDASSCTVYIASASRIYKLRIALEDSVVGQGKQNLLIPERTQVLESSLVDRCPHRSEIQSIVLAETKSMGRSLLGSVDSYGDLIVSRVDDFNTDGSTYSVSPRDCGVGEGSWAGLCFNPGQLSMAATARSFCKSIDIYDHDIHLRTLRTLGFPTSLIFMDSFSEGGNSMLATTEGSQLSIWDLRVKENGGCVQRIMGSVGDMLYAVSISSSGNIAAGGEDRTVTVYDPRRWCATSRWLNCSKYEITGLTFSSVDPSYIYVQGVDYEIICGQWREREKAFSFRGDSNWLGFSKCSDRDILAGWCDSGSIFVADAS
ncbi:uncharacterized protein LOC131011693 isoform X2 [Salvia miltiorrhiza]|uniref:uncharacterized protein LOC131011659 isoform X2 n=1 Tax=Salvia miltiorrhiza TaxID=226208 RepID=UPI0025ABFD6F|nr:uncharacterized protein LOC131011659 isoform X2 [Salvia miltiorrhiza]XP_057795471.1 uncharacterized protein LOC131011693 isoform X2 [Salvia miltiorrhiza]